MLKELQYCHIESGANALLQLGLDKMSAVRLTIEEENGDMSIAFEIFEEHRKAQLFAGTVDKVLIKKGWKRIWNPSNQAT